ncbi:MAG TPA: heavy metal-binding domain-containing protein [Planctomycetota bacterium]|nr:heavy metal-binding domain-containing protein [Planctomycetota bacterium]
MWTCSCGKLNRDHTNRCSTCGSVPPSTSGQLPSMGPKIVVNKPVVIVQGSSGARAARPYPALSDLSATEFVTLARMGFYPHGLVLGASVYDAGWGGIQLGTQEVTSLSSAMRQARHLAVERMKQQAEAVGAEGIVGVRLQVEHHTWHGGHNVARFLAIGTAIGFDADRAPLELRDSPSLTVGGRPFTSGLSGQDFVLLLRAGYRPIAVAIGNCVYHLGFTLTNVFSGNTEITSYTQAFMDARELAMERMTQDLMKEVTQPEDHPVGIVGMSVDEEEHGAGSKVVEYMAVGTAIAPLAANDPRRGPTLPEPQVVVPLDV